MRYDIRTVTPAVYDTNNYVVLDFETDTSHGDYGHPVHPANGVVLSCFKRAGSRTEALWSDEYGLGDLIDIIEATDLLVAHNGKYELGWLARAGCDLSKVLLFDTKLAEYVLMGNLAAGDDLNAPRGTSLDECCLRRGLPSKDPVTDLLITHGVNPVNIPRPWLEGRCRQDVDSTEWLFLNQREQLRESGRLGVALTRAILTPALVDIEGRNGGMMLDAERTEDTFQKYDAEYALLSTQMETMTGGLNWKSVPQVAEFLYNPTKPEPKFDDEGRALWLVPNRRGRLLEMVEGPAMDKAIAYHEAKWEDTELTQSGREETALPKPLFKVLAMTRPGLGFQELRKNGEPKRTPEGVRVLKNGTVKRTGGQPLTDQKTIDQLKATTKKQKEFIELRKRLGKVNAALTKSLRFFVGVTREYGGVFHAEINQTKTATHRTSSTGIPLVFKTVLDSDGQPAKLSAQMQNLANAFKPLFRARQGGRLLAEADGSQLEFRTAGQVSRDAQMVADILDPNFDAHIASAAAMHGVPYDELMARYRAGDPEAIRWRKGAKPDTFGPLYGKSHGTPEQLRWIEAFRQRYPEFYAFSERNVRTVLVDRVLELPWGMRYYWPHAKANSRGDYVNCRTAVYNYPIQGFATAEIIPIAVAAFRQRIREATSLKPGDIVMLNTVHDSIICDIAESALPVWREIATQAFTSDVYAYLRNVYHYDFDLVPLGVGMNYGTHWADPTNAEEEWDVFPDGRRVKRK
jgi:DNA polymerase I-like protein with 3'-5' exonuclease and polymerase domains